ncbi:MAG: glycine--tRNA ligase subunit beta, partial [Acidobacteria bacterium]|nr:glycine--tRNA ligase subunit beta [Acidobacteriota bacterium]
ANGKPTKALEGFLRKSDASEKDVEKRDGYVWVTKRVAGETAAGFFAGEIPAVFEKLRWPKMMRWRQDHEWIRPVHGVVALFDGKVVPLSIFGVESGSSTFGHRTRSSNDPIEVAGYDSYVEALAEASVVCLSDERAATLRERAAALASEAGGSAAEDGSIWDQWKFLTEFPGVVRAEFEEEYLELPAEVLTTVMRVHQKQLPITREGKLTSSFLAVMDAPDDPQGLAASGNAFVTNARFADALFFYRQDRKTPLADRGEQLRHLQFQEKLGDYGAKTERIEKLAQWIREVSSSKVSREAVTTAAGIMKADLVTEMVKELTELQGRIGGIYAREEGYAEEVWQAVYDQYLPQSIDDPLPRGELGMILSLADRADTLAGFFLLGLEPTGSRDPFALRRAAQGIIRILFGGAEGRLVLDTGALIRKAIAGLSGDFPVTEEEAARKLTAFLEERVRSILELDGGFAYDEIDAAVAAGWEKDLPDLEARVRALREVRERPDFLSILDSARRIANITPEGFEGTLRVDLLEHDSEKGLAELVELVNQQIAESIRERNHLRALQTFAGMAGDLERFFEDVMVNVEDVAIRENRIALLQKAASGVRPIGDVTRIVVDRKSLASKD